MDFVFVPNCSDALWFLLPYSCYDFCSTRWT